MQHFYEVSVGNIRLRPLDIEDIELLRIWRNDKSKTRYLRSINYITPSMQEKWYNDYLIEAGVYTFAIEDMELKNHLIGSISIYNLERDRAEIGRLQIGNEHVRGKGYGKIAVMLASKIAFEEMNIKMLYATVNSNNVASYKSFIRCGYYKEPQIGIHIREDELCLICRKNDLR